MARPDFPNFKFRFSALVLGGGGSRVPPAPPGAYGPPTTSLGGAVKAEGAGVEGGPFRRRYREANVAGGEAKAHT